jgi:hypothetical protein
MAQRVTLSHQGLQVLRSDEEKTFKNIVNGNSSWFFLELLITSSGSRSRSDLRSLPNKISRPKRASFRSLSFPTVSIPSCCPTKEHYNSTLFANLVAFDLQTNLCLGTRRKTLKFWIVRLNNVPAHNSERPRDALEAIAAVRVPHPAYRADIAPNDLYLFRNLKEKL